MQHSGAETMLAIEDETRERKRESEKDILGGVYVNQELRVNAEIYSSPYTFLDAINISKQRRARGSAFRIGSSRVPLSAHRYIYICAYINTNKRLMPLTVIHPRYNIVGEMFRKK